MRSRQVRRRRPGHRGGQWAAYAFVGLGAAMMLLPFVAGLANSLKTYAEYISVPPQWIPDPPQWSNYSEVWDRAQFGAFALNSFVIALLAVAGNLLTSAMVGHALARMRLPGKEVLLVAALGTLMLPPVLTIVPNFILYKNLGWLDSMLPLLVPYWLATPFGIFLMRQAFLMVPREFEEAATLDGANPWQVFWRVHIPLVRPSLATLGLFTFMTSWGAVLEPTVYLTSPEKFTLPIGVLSLTNQFGGSEQLLTAAALMSLVPMLLIYLVAQRHFESGAWSSGVKG